jgi:peptidoglycan/LPS O-acetylase OafA/YrhL
VTRKLSSLPSAFPQGDSSATAVRNGGAPLTARPGRAPVHPVLPLKEGYHPQLDALRAALALLVVWQHAGAQPWTGVRGIGLDGVGIYAVRVFFVLSAFLITGILLRARDRRERMGGTLRGTLGTFYARRALRIFPAYYLLLVVAVAIGVSMRPGELAAALTYRTNWFITGQQQWPPALGHLWSLAIEEQFYIVWPFVVLLIPRPWLPRALTLAAVFSIAVRIRHSLAPGVTDHAVLVGTMANLEALALGALLAWHWHVRPEATSTRARLVWLGAVIGAALLTFIAWTTAHVGHVKIFGIIEVTSGALLGVWLVDRLAVGLGGPFASVLTARPLLWLGSISYGIYLYHELLRWVLFTFNRAHPAAWNTRGTPAFVLLLIAATIALAEISARFIERPINALKRAVPYAGARG